MDNLIIDNYSCTGAQKSNYFVKIILILNIIDMLRDSKKENRNNVNENHSTVTASI